MSTYSTPTVSSTEQTSEQNSTVSVSRGNRNYTLSLDTSGGNVKLAKLGTTKIVEGYAYEFFDGPDGCSGLEVSLTDVNLDAQADMTAIKYTDTHAHLHHLRVSEPIRGEGYATMLLDIFLAYCAATGIETISIKFANDGGKEFLHSYGLTAYTGLFDDPEYRHESVIVGEQPIRAVDILRRAQHEDHTRVTTVLRDAFPEYGLPVEKVIESTDCTISVAEGEQ